MRRVRRERTIFPMSSSLTSIRPSMRSGVLPLLSAVSSTPFALSQKEGEKASAQLKLNDMLFTGE